jgi:hypothetical protein
MIKSVSPLPGTAEFVGGGETAIPPQKKHEHPKDIRANLCPKNQ